MDKFDKEYYELLKQHLNRAYKELQELRDRVDKKIVEINEIEELMDTIEEKVNEKIL